MRNATHWDFVLTCFEPVVAVTGGIGTYTRLLLQRLDRMQIDGRPVKVLFFTAAPNKDLKNDLALVNVTTEYVETTATAEGLPINNLADPFFHYGFNVMRRMQALAAEGHTFATAEFPDYNAEGYYPIKARALGLLDIGRVLVRLHSPLLMLAEDNAYGAPSVLQRRFFAAERYCYAHADGVLFGGDAMRDRVASLLPSDERERFLAKAAKIPHPWPAPIAETTPAKLDAARVHVGYVGRLEYRKGVDLLVRAGVRALSKTKRPFTLHFFGRDTTTWNGTSMRAHLDSLIPEGAGASFAFHDYVPQEELRRARLPAMDAFAFPSRFENYPNVLLEVLALDRPVMVSPFGCMPEMGQNFSSVESVDPNDSEALAAALARHVDAAPERFGAASLYEKERARIDADIEAGYAKQLKKKPAKRRAEPEALPSIAFVVPHHNHARWVSSLVDSIRPQLREGDEVIVVDDCSRADEAASAKAQVEKAGFRFVSTPVNSGPSVARNLGASLAKADLLYFVDADDELAAESVAPLRRAFALHRDLDVLSGFMRAFNDENHYWAAYDPTPSTILVENSSHCGIVIRRKVFERLGGYSEAMRLHLEDWEFHARLVMQGLRFEILPLVTYRYRVNKKTGRDASQPLLRQRSYELVVQQALQAVPPDRLNVVWPELSGVMAGLLRQNAELLQYAARPPELRYRIADAINDAVKRTNVHGPLKKIVGKAVKRPRAK